MKKICQKTCIIVAFSLFAAGCSPAKISQSPQQTYQGYPCDVRCDAFQAGFDTAKQQQFTADSQCSELNKTQHIGCLSYLHEYHLEHDQPAGYSFPLEARNVN